MEVALTPGHTALVINLITDILTIVTVCCVVRTFNSYGRWILYRKGTVPIGMNFHEMSFFSAFRSAIRSRKGSRTVFFSLCVQTVVYAIVVVLRTIAPVGICEVQNWTVLRHRTVQGDALCLGFDNVELLPMTGEAAQRIVTHFKAGGGLFAVGKTGRKSDALILEDDKWSFGPSIILNEWNGSIQMNISAVASRDEYLVDMNTYEFFKIPRSSVGGIQSNSIMMNRALFYPTGRKETEGPLFVVVSDTMHEQGTKMERYAFGICAVPNTSLLNGQFTVVTGNCTVSNLERDVTRAGMYWSIVHNAGMLRYIHKSLESINMSITAQKYLMVSDVAHTLIQEPCGTTYEAYLSQTEVKTSSIAILSAFGFICFVVFLAAFMAFASTWNTLNWNGSYQRLMELALTSISDSCRVESAGDAEENSETKVVVERLIEPPEGVQYHAHVVPRGCLSYPVPAAKVSSIELPRKKV